MGPFPNGLYFYGWNKWSPSDHHVSKSWDNHPSTSYKYGYITPIRTVFSPQIPFNPFIYKAIGNWGYNPYKMELLTLLTTGRGPLSKGFSCCFPPLDLQHMQRSAKGGTMRLLVTLTHRWPYPCHETRIGVCFTCFKALRTWIFVSVTSHKTTKTTNNKGLIRGY